jgi:small conductance mechanosensitive channel
LIGSLSGLFKEAAGQLLSAVDALNEAPAAARWIRDQMADAATRNLWLRLIFKLALIIAAGLVAERLVRFAVSRLRGAVEERDTESLLVRLFLLLVRTIVDVIPIAVFAGAAYAMIPVVRPSPEIRVVAITIINAYLLVRGVMVVVRMALAPRVSSLRVLPMADITANYLSIWVRRLIVVAVFGYFLAEAALLLGLPAGGRMALLHLVGLVIAAMLIVFIQQNRRPVANWIQGAEGSPLARLGGHRLRQRFADVWHVLAIVYVAGVYGAWTLGIEGGFENIVRATVISALVLIVARLAVHGLHRAVERGFALRDEIKERFPSLESRANRYLPSLHRALRVVVYILAALAVLQAWGINAVGWLETPFGQRLMQSGFSIAVVVVAALLVWEAASAAIERYLSPVDAGGNAVERSARSRTLLPLLRNFLAVILSVMVTLIVLSELGVNIGPLLAGAGVVGLAIGFGSQKLVQDVINGAFILFEDAISVGDVVTVAGKTGTVEALSIRALRLRDLSGSVHTIPFSTVETVTNLTKDFSYYVFEIGVAYRENTDEVADVLRQISTGMEADEEYGPLILAPLEVLGVDQFADSAVILKARVKTVPVKQWYVGREFNRRIKLRFDEEGIEMPYPHTTLYFGEDKEYAVHIYPNVNHGFHNDTTPRYDEAAAKIAWKRTIDFFGAKLR